MLFRSLRVRNTERTHELCLVLCEEARSFSTELRLVPQPLSTERRTAGHVMSALVTSELDRWKKKKGKERKGRKEGTYLSIIVQRTNFLTYSARFSLSRAEAFECYRLTVVVRDRVRSTLCGGVYSVLDDVLMEFPVALLDESHEPAVGKTPDSRANYRPDEIAQTCGSTGQVKLRL